ncbi:S-layer homology domain-containing protein [Agathobaculum sp. NTUH-O15-33]|uniref:S-layer homology domain-containing protein n=1 Tax=Agathobaculum sp. NTUH-O15-33 TaxID=3079302 RepID=UPI002958CA7C|nr:S-layer homology domain-containing protein [Agathobaculum sp. NTUH-O15-33]WNX83801.1 S-layer homology domain-containing protein [Agathobaculum sp. NTUH-O15-33]
MTHRSHLFKRWAAALLSACLLLTLLPTAALAEEGPRTVTHGETIQNDTGESMEVVCGTNSLPYTIPADGKFVYVELGSNLETYEVADDVTHVLATSLGEEVEGGLRFGNLTSSRSAVNITAYNLRQRAEANSNISSAGLELPHNSSLTVRGDCAFYGPILSGRRGFSLGLAGAALTLTVDPDASLTAIGGDSEYPTVTDAGIYAVISLTIVNHGKIECYGGRDTATGAFLTDSSGIYDDSQTSLIVSGSGTLTCLGDRGIDMDNISQVSGTVSLEGGSVTVGGNSHGIQTHGGAVTVAAGVNARVIGGVEGTVEGDTSGLTVIDQTLDEIIGAEDALDLTGETAEKLFLVEMPKYDGSPSYPGTVHWTPAADGAHARLALTAFTQDDTNNSLYLAGGVKLPENTAVDIELSANSALENSDGDAIHAPGGALTFHTDYLETDPDSSLRPSIRGLTAASATFTGGDFSTYGTLDAPVTVTGDAGNVAMLGGETPEGTVSPVPKGLTIIPSTNTHAELYTLDRDTEARAHSYKHLAGSPSNSTITYAGGESYLFAAIVPGAAEEEEEHHNSSSSSTPTYAVVYHANYANGPADVRDSGHRSGASVTLKAADLFKAPEGKTFAGWAESASGSVKYKASEQIKMPANTLNLYAVWNAKGTAPGLNQEDHIAYLSGYPDGSARPEANITREEVAAIFYRLLDDATRDAYHTTSSPFPDVASSRWSAEAIATLANAGILKGEKDGKFYPERPITRAEFAAIAARFDPSDYDGADQFPDIANHWARNEINHAYMRGWVRGTPDGRFEPDRYITRAEAVTLVNRVLNRAPEAASDLLPGMQTFTDNTDAARWYYLDIQEAANAHDYDRKADGVHEKWTALR